MGCISSKLLKKENEEESPYMNHVVSLTSSTYGSLKLDEEEEEEKQSIHDCAITGLDQPRVSGVINTWELMEDLEEQNQMDFAQLKKYQKANLFLHGFGDMNVGRRSFRLLSQLDSPVVQGRKSLDKENKGRIIGKSRSIGNSLREVFKEINVNLKKPCSKYEILESSITPPGCENGVVIYTTTLRGIRKTYEDCNVARSILESHHVKILERDISMHSGFKEELRMLSKGGGGVRLPLVFVKGRLIGGVEEMMRLDEEGDLEVLLDGIPKAEDTSCEGCGGIRFVMCRECDGSRKILGEDGMKSVKCSECNENGLIKCPFCSS